MLKKVALELPHSHNLKVELTLQQALEEKEDKLALMPKKEALVPQVHQPMAVDNQPQ